MEALASVEGKAGENRRSPENRRPETNRAPQKPCEDCGEQDCRINPKQKDGSAEKSEHEK